MTREEFLLYALSANGVSAIVGFITSVFIPLLWPRWSEWDSQNRNRLMLILNFAVPMLAALALYGGSAEHVWLAMVVGFQASFTGYGANQATYKALGVGKRHEQA